jgi:hypothetical protein
MSALTLSSTEFKNVWNLTSIVPYKYSWSGSSRVLYLTLPELYMGGTRKRSWLGHYATSRKVADSIPDEIIGFFN